MTKLITTNTPDQEKPKMKKYIVEAPEPKMGQKVSSGGIRENGKLSSQFKNPIPYDEPSHNKKEEFGNHVLNMIWQEFGEPLLRSGLRKLGETIINKLEAPSTRAKQQICTHDTLIIDVPENQIETIHTL